MNMSLTRILKPTGNIVLANTEREFVNRIFWAVNSSKRGNLTSLRVSGNCSAIKESRGIAPYTVTLSFPYEMRGVSFERLGIQYDMLYNFTDEPPFNFTQEIHDKLVQVRDRLVESPGTLSDHFTTKAVIIQTTTGPELVIPYTSCFASTG